MVTGFLPSPLFRSSLSSPPSQVVFNDIFWMNVYGSRKIVEIFPSLENSCWPVQPRKVKLSRGGAEGNQAFVKGMETEENYVQPRMKFLESEFRSDVGCLRGYYLLKKMSDDD